MKDKTLIGKEIQLLEINEILNSAIKKNEPCCIFLSGEYGIGKSFIVEYILQEHIPSDYNVIKINTFFDDIKSTAELLHKIFPDVDAGENPIEIYFDFFLDLVSSQNVVFVFEEIQRCYDIDFESFMDFVRKINDAFVIIATERQTDENKNYTQKSDKILKLIKTNSFSLADTSIYISHFFESNTFSFDFSNQIFKFSAGNPLFIKFLLLLFKEKKIIFRRNSIYNVQENYLTDIPLSLQGLIHERIVILEQKLNFLSEENDNNIEDIINSIEEILNVLIENPTFVGYFDLDEISNLIIKLQDKFSSFKKLLKLVRILNSDREQIKTEDITEDYIRKLIDNIKEALKKYEIKKIESFLHEINFVLDTKLDFVKKYEFDLILYKNKILDFYGKYDQAAKLAQKMLDIAEKTDDSRIKAIAYARKGKSEYSFAHYEKAESWYSLSLDENLNMHNTKYIAMLYAELGLTYTARALYETALFYYEKALNFKHELDNDTLARIYDYYGSCLRMFGKQDDALKYYEEEQKLIKEFDYINARIYNNIGLVFYSKGLFGKSMPYFHKAISIANKYGDIVNIANYYSNLGLVENGMGRYKKAIKYFYKSLEIDEVLQDKPRIAISYNNIGMAKIAIGEIDLALDLFNKAFAIYTELNDLPGLAFTYSSIGNAYFYKNNIEKALDFFNKSVEINKRLNDIVGLANDYNNIGNVYYNFGNKEKAREYFDKSLKIVSEIGDKHSLSALYNNLANLYFLENKYDEAIDFYRLAQNVNISLDDKIAIAMNYNNMAGIYASKREFGQAIDLYKKALEIDKELDDKIQIASHSFNLAKTYMMARKPDLAIEYYKIAANIFESVANYSEAGLSYRDLGIALIGTGNDNEGEKYLKHSLLLLESKEDNLDRADAVFALLHFYYEKDRLKDFLLTYDNFINFLISSDDASLLYSSIRRLIAYNHSFSKKEKITQLLKHAANLLLSAKKWQDYIDLVSEVSKFYIDLQDFSTPIHFFENAVDIDRKYLDSANRPFLLMALGSMLIIKKELDKAIKYLNESLVLLRQMGDKHLIADNLVALSDIYATKKDNISEYEYLEEALNLYIDLDSVREIGLVALRLLEISVMKDYKDKIHEFFSYASGHLAKADEIFNLIKTYIIMANADISDALPHIYEAIKIFKSNKNNFDNDDDYAFIILSLINVIAKVSVIRDEINIIPDEINKALEQQKINEEKRRKEIAILLILSMLPDKTLLSERLSDKDLDFYDLNYAIAHPNINEQSEIFAFLSENALMPDIKAKAVISLARVYLKEGLFKNLKNIISKLDNIEDTFYYRRFVYEILAEKLISEKKYTEALEKLFVALSDSIDFDAKQKQYKKIFIESTNYKPLTFLRDDLLLPYEHTVRLFDKILYIIEIVVSAQNEQDEEFLLSCATKLEEAVFYKIPVKALKIRGLIIISKIYELAENKNLAYIFKNYAIFFDKHN